MLQQFVGGAKRLLSFLCGVFCALAVLGAMALFVWNDLQPQGKKFEFLGMTLFLAAFVLSWGAWAAFSAAFRKR